MKKSVRDFAPQTIMTVVNPFTAVPQASDALPSPVTVPPVEGNREVHMGCFQQPNLAVLHLRSASCFIMDMDRALNHSGISPQQDYIPILQTGIGSWLVSHQPCLLQLEET